MTTFENVTVVKEGNSYFDGAVTSRTLIFEDGSKKSLGFMLPGEYYFGTEDAELMEITSGTVEIRLKDQSEWRSIKAGDSFCVDANSGFDIKVLEITDYCCSYMKENAS